MMSVETQPTPCVATQYRCPRCNHTWIAPPITGAGMVQCRGCGHTRPTVGPYHPPPAGIAAFMAVR